MAVASLLPMLLGYTGLVGLMLDYIGPLTIGPAITMIGISTFETAGDYSAQNWGIALL